MKKQVLQIVKLLIIFILLTGSILGYPGITQATDVLTQEKVNSLQQKIDGGTYHSLALKSDGTVVAWGKNDNGQSTVPSGLSGVVAVSGGTNHSLALKSDGTVVAWGNNDNGQSTVPSELSGVIAISGGNKHSLALKNDGTVVAWGDNFCGQINVPSELSGVVAISAGWSHSLALKSDGTVVAWGFNYYGECNVPSELSGVVAISGGEHSLALKSDGTVVAWGFNYDGQCNVPSGLSGVVAISAGWSYSLALKSDGTVVAWGSNGLSKVPSGLSGVVAISSGWCYSLALKSDGTVVAWGFDRDGQCNVPSGLNLTSSNISASPSSVTADGIATSTITVTLKDIFDNPLSGKVVSITQGSGSSLIPNVQETTGVDGTATFTVSNTKSEAVTYTATNTTDNITLSPTALVQFIPSITSITPDSGLEAGGTSVTIAGIGFIEATAVKFGSKAATNYTVDDNQTITATVPSGNGTVDVTVTTPAGTSTTGSSIQYNYIAPIGTAVIAGVTAPVRGATPVSTIADTSEYTATISWSPSGATFASSTDYTATITITPKVGYTLSGVAADFFTVAGATTVTNSADSGVVIAKFPATAAPIGIAVIEGVTAPVRGATPVSTIADTSEYTATISWSPSGATFASSTDYTATITITPKVGYTLSGVTADFFTVAGATTVTNSADSGVVTAVFPATAAAPIGIAAIAGVTVPVRGATPVSTIADTSEYTATISWSPPGATFASSTEYTATITITPKVGYTLSGVAADFFTVAGATTVTNSADSGVVIAKFPATAAAPYQPPTWYSVDGVSLDKSTMNLTFGGAPKTLTASVQPSYASNPAVSWSSSEPTVASVNGGVLTPLAPGKTTITVITSDGGKTASCLVEVKAAVVGVSGISLDRSSLLMLVGSNPQAIVASVQPTNASNMNVTWNSSVPSVASVNGGVVTPLAPGKTTITVTTSDGGKTASCLVEVKAAVVSVSGITLDRGRLLMELGSSPQTIVASVQPTNASNKHVTWSSSDPTVASVNGGVVTPLTSGKTTITVTTNDGRKTASCTAIVTPSPGIDTQWDERQAEQSVGKDKTWQIKFSKAVGPESINRQNIMVLDSNNEPVEIDVKADPEDVKIILVTPKDQYNKGEQYRLFLGVGLGSSKGKSLSKGILYRFNVE